MYGGNSRSGYGPTGSDLEVEAGTDQRVASYTFLPARKLAAISQSFLSMVSAHVLEHPNDEQVEEMVQLLMRAHHGQIIVDMLTDSTVSIQEAWHRLGIRAGALEGKIWVIFEPLVSGAESTPQGVASAQPAIVSLIVAFGPGAMPMGSEGQRALGLAQYLDSLSPEGKKWQQEVFHPTTARLVTDSVGQQKVIGSWLPILVATDPNHQGRGYASALMRELQRTAQEDNMDVFLTTFSDELESYYQHLQFDTRAKAEIASPLGSWTHRVMLWESEASS